MPKITFDKVEKRYEGHQALHPLDLELADGEFTVLVGPSGCGKSTTLRILAGLEGLDGGQIRFDDRLVSDKQPKDRDLAMVFQDYALYPHMNVARNMSFALRLQRVPKQQVAAKVRKVAETLNIAHLLARKPAELSGGQRQRVAMGRALVRDASTFLFDEPLSNLDAKLRARMRVELAEMRQQLNKNMIYVTHDQVEAMTLGDRIVVMADGAVQQQGTPQELYRRPANRFVAGFIGSPAMNFLDAELTERAGKLVAAGDGFALELAAGALRPDAAAQVTVGVRPHCLRAAGPGSPIELDVVVTEYLGNNAVLFARCGAAEVLIERDAGLPAAAGDRLTCHVAAEDILVFDRAAGACLNRPAVH